MLSTSRGILGDDENRHKVLFFLISSVADGRLLFQTSIGRSLTTDAPEKCVYIYNINHKAIKRKSKAN